MAMSTINEGVDHKCCVRSKFTKKIPKKLNQFHVITENRAGVQTTGLYRRVRF